VSGAPHLVHAFSTFGRGGPPSRTARIINGLGDAYRHTIVVIGHNVEAHDWIHPARDVDFLVCGPGELGPVPPLRLLSTLRRLRPDLVLTYNWGAMEVVAATRLGRWPLIHAEDGFNPDEATRQKPRRVWARRLLLRGADCMVVPSHRLRRIATEDWWFPTSRLLLLPNGVDCDRFHPGSAPSARRHLGIGRGELVVGTVGNLAGSKNVGLLVRAVDRLDRTDVRLLVIGDGPQRARIESLATELGVAERVMLPGSKAEVAPYLRAMDVFALGSRTEQMPIAVLEAMASGLPVASTDVGDVRRMLAEANRPFVVGDDDADAMAGALSTLLRDPELRSRIGEANRERCSVRYDLGSVIARYGRLYEAVMGGDDPGIRRDRDASDDRRSSRDRAA